MTGVSAIAGSATPGATEAMTSGRYKLTIDSVGALTGYTVTNLDNSTWQNNGSIAVSNADLSTATGSSGALTDGTGITETLGITLTPTTAGVFSDLVAGQSMTFEQPCRRPGQT